MNIEGEGIKQEAPKAELLPERWSKPAESREVQEALHQLFEQTLDLARQLQPELTNGEYRLIVGDDASGRLATLVMRDVANALQALVSEFKKYKSEPA